MFVSHGAAGSSRTTISTLWPRFAIPRLKPNTAAATPPTLGSSVCTNCRIFRALDNETFRALEILEVRRELFNRASRHAAVKLMGFSERFVHQGFGSHNAEIRQDTATQKHAVRPDKTVVTNSYRQGSLATPLNIDAVSHDLRLHAGERAELDRKSVV